jgi:2-phosphosulfolactate phosphatase
MHVYFEVGPSGASAAGSRGDVCIVVDVLRASSSIIAALMGRFARIKLADTLPKVQQDVIICGEIEGQKISGFDYGNSPIELLHNQHANRELLFFSTNGIPCILACMHGASVVLIGALLNAHAVGKMAEKIAIEQHKNISIILAGYHGKLEHDDLIAGSVIYELSLFPAEIRGNIHPIHSVNDFEELLKSESAQRLMSIQCDADIQFCGQRDITSLVPIVDRLTRCIKIKWSL